MRIQYLLVIIALLALAVPAPAVHAGGVVTVCDEAHLLAALAGGGTMTFACSGVITLTNTTTITADTTIDGSGQNVKINGNQALRVFWVNSGVMLNLTEITVVGGYAGIGAGIYNDGGTVTVSNSAFAGNIAVDGGGGIANVGGTLIVSNSIFSDNSTLGFGGGIYNHGPLTVSNSSFSGNDSDFGGGIFSRESELTVSNSTFSGNIASGYYGRGGGIDSYGGTLIVSNSTFAGNHAIDGGGGIYSYGTLTVTNSLFSDNFVMMGSGSGIGNQSGTATVSNSIFSGNSVGQGAGAATTLASPPACQQLIPHNARCLLVYLSTRRP